MPPYMVYTTVLTYTINCFDTERKWRSYVHICERVCAVEKGKALKRRDEIFGFRSLCR